MTLTQQRPCDHVSPSFFISSRQRYTQRRKYSISAGPKTRKSNIRDMPSRRHSSQALLSGAIDKALLDGAVNNPSDLARLQAVSSPNSSDGISAVPSPGLGFRLDADEVQILVKLRLGLPVATEGATCPLCPGKALDPQGHHALTCRRGPDVTSRHNSLRNTVFNTCRRGLLNPILEQGASQGSLTRPADVLITVWSLG
jgi:hypothetical protein